MEQNARLYEPAGTLRLSNHTNTEHFFEFCLQFFRQAGPPKRADCLAPVEISVKCFFQGHSDALPVQESNKGSATFRSPARLSTTE